ncbi:MAG: FAD-dependent oxidoreductase [Victivallales bacterium]|nr:FAD-dependent oxidoreductase [Victivallales bacterium]
MKTIQEVLTTPVAGEYDVLVAGAGPAGVAAAVSAGRLGARTCLVEQSGMVGGVATSGLMSHWTGNTRGGIYEEILDRSHDENAPNMRKVIHTEKLQNALLEMLQEANVDLRLYSFAAKPVMENGAVAGLVIESKAGRQALASQVLVDATGDGDVAARAGAAFALGREEDSSMQPMTLMFRLGGVDMSRAIHPGSFETKVEVPHGEIQALARQELAAPAGHVLLYFTTLSGIVTANMTNCIQVDGTNPQDLTKATIQCRKQMEAIVAFLQRHAPGYEHCYLLQSAAQIGVRETRHFKGLYTLTSEDILAARVFPDWVVTKAHFNFDIHNVQGAGLDANGCQHKFSQPRGYTIPYRCLVPESIDGLLLAGRNISGTHQAHSNFRAMPICANIGQAAGIAAALSSQKGIRPRDLPASEIQTVLRQCGVEP